MQGLKRFCLIAFAVVGIVLVAVLALPWIGPWTALFTSFFAIEWYLFAVELCLLVVVIGFVAVFVRGVTTRRHHDVEVLSEQGARVTIARSAIASQATYLAEQDGTCVVTKVVVKVHGHESVDVRVSVQPYQSVNVQVEAQRLQKRLREGLERLCGDALHTITLRFLEPRSTGDIGPGATVTRNPKGGYTPSATHVVNREIRHVDGAPAVSAPDYGIEGGGPTVRVEPTPTPIDQEG